MNNYIGASGLIHEVTEERYESSDGNASLRLRLRCGGYTWAERDLEWRVDGVVTCLWCIVFDLNDVRFRKDP